MKNKNHKEWQLKMDLKNLRTSNTEDPSDMKNSDSKSVSSERYKNKYKDYFHNAADLIALLDTNGVFLEVNKRFERESGYSEKEIIGKNVHELEILTK